MLMASSYPQVYIDACRASFAARVAAYDALTKDATGPAAEAFEPAFFGALLLALDHCFCHRGRGMEGKDGNPLNEARVLCNSLMEHGGTMTADKSVRLKPEASLLGYAPGDQIVLRRDDFVHMADGFLAEIERRYP